MIDITETEACEILAALELRAHQYRVKGTTHQSDVQELHEKLRKQFIAKFNWPSDGYELRMTNQVVVIRSTSVRGL